jgi:hypothetical protein
VAVSRDATHLLIALVALAGACQRPHAAPPRPHVEILEASPGPVDAVVRAALNGASHDHRRLLIYVSAVWCEPCERFQKAVRSGKLDASFPDLRLLKFDNDRDLDRLTAAGYGGEFIPRFVIPGPDGRGTDQRMEGGTKAEDTVSTSIGPRLRRLLYGAPSGG